MDNSNDANGRPWAKLNELKAGDRIELDAGFTCHEAGIAEVLEDKHGLYFKCDGNDDPEYGEQDRHYLHGQADDGVHLIGIYGPVQVPAQA